MNGFSTPSTSSNADGGMTGSGSGSGMFVMEPLVVPPAVTATGPAAAAVPIDDATVIPDRAALSDRTVIPDRTVVSDHAAIPDATRVGAPVGRHAGPRSVDDATHVRPVTPDTDVTRVGMGPRRRRRLEQLAQRTNQPAGTAAQVPTGTPRRPQPDRIPARPGPSRPLTSRPATAPPPTTPRPPADNDLYLFQHHVELLAGAIARTIVGKEESVRHSLIALIAGGHLLLEDVPGTGKTRLARAIAQSLDVPFKRIQFTPDLLPGDVTGVTFYDRRTSTFTFREGPVFASVVLADEINRASAKTQSALLEVMEEGGITVDGATHAVPQPFLVIATQNPAGQLGTYRLPEAQMDRFLLTVTLGHPGHEASLDILRRQAAERAGLGSDAISRADGTGGPAAVLTGGDVLRMRAMAARIHCDDRVLEYIVRLTEATRHQETLASGSSIRGALALDRCARVLAAMNGRTYVIPSDVSQLAVPVLAHRVTLHADAAFEGGTAAAAIERVLEEVPPPSTSTEGR